MNRNFALIADGDVFDVIRIDASNPIAEKYYAGLSSDPIFIECTNYDVFPGSTYDGTYFYKASDVEQKNPIIINPEQNDANRVYALIVDGDVFGTMVVLKDMANFDIVVAGMSSNPKCVECTDNLFVDVGWTWDGQTFKPPL